MSTKVILKARKAKPFWCGEPWIFDGSIDRIKGSRDLRDGDIVEVQDDQGRPIGQGFFNARSAIRVRLLAWGPESAGEDLIRARLHRAVELRDGLLGLGEQADVYRLVHAEGDGLPGLVVDRLGDCLVVQFDTLGIRRFRDLIVNVLAEIRQPRAIWERVSRVARDQEGIEDIDEGLRYGEEPDGPIDVHENGVRYAVDFRAGQKTGFYSDQRDNRLALSRIARGRRALDCFSYSGAFGLNLLKNGGAPSVLAIDSSAPALESAVGNAALNGLGDRFATERGERPALPRSPAQG